MDAGHVVLDDAAAVLRPAGETGATGLEVKAGRAPGMHLRPMLPGTFEDGVDHPGGVAPQTGAGGKSNDIHGSCRTVALLFRNPAASVDADDGEGLMFVRQLHRRRWPNHAIGMVGVYSTAHGRSFFAAHIIIAAGRVDQAPQPVWYLSIVGG